MPSYAETSTSQVQEQPMAAKVVARLSENIKIMEDRLLSIEEKCHNVLNLREPTKEVDKKPTPMDRDFFETMNNRIDLFYELNNRLERINRHLGQIIG